jgi:radial spoke head protein 4/6
LLNDWIQLPDCLPNHIEAARQIKHIMTGDLNADVFSNPMFPGKERHFLRAQLARIFAATTISPKGLFEIDEETNLMKFAEEFTMPSCDELKSLETWSNVAPSILKNGRTTYIAPEGLDEEAKEAFLSEAAEKDPQVERFRTLNEHAPLLGMETAWISKVAGDAQ